MNIQKLIVLFLCVATAICVKADQWPRLDFQKEQLAALFRQLDLPFSDNYQAVVDQVQQHFLRPGGIERWQVADRYVAQRAILTPLLKDLGFIAEKAPLQQHYDYVIIFGSTVKGMERRLDYLVKLWNQGVRFDQIVFLVGERKLEDFELEHLEVRYAQRTQGTLENGAARIIYTSAFLSVGLQKIPVTFIDTPTKLVGEKLQRPTTVDTILMWLETKPTPGTVLAITNQPYVLYQQAVAQRLFAQTGFNVECVGAAAGAHVSMAIALDSLARYLYVKNETQNSPEKIS